MVLEIILYQEKLAVVGEETMGEGALPHNPTRIPSSPLSLPSKKTPRPSTALPQR